MWLSLQLLEGVGVKKMDLFWHGCTVSPPTPHPDGCLRRSSLAVLSGIQPCYREPTVLGSFSFCTLACAVPLSLFLQGSMASPLLWSLLRWHPSLPVPCHPSGID